MNFIAYTEAGARLRDGYRCAALRVGCSNVIRSNWAIIGEKADLKVAKLQHQACSLTATEGYQSGLPVGFGRSREERTWSAGQAALWQHYHIF